MARVSYGTNTAQQLQFSAITSRGAHALMWAYYLTSATLALLALDDVVEPVIVYLSVLIFGAICVVLVHSTGERSSVSVSIFVIAASLAATLISLWNTLGGGFSQWYVGAAALTMFYLSMRGRVMFAWLGFAMISLAVLAWGLTTHDRGFDALILVLWQVPMVAIGTLFSWGMRRMCARLALIHDNELARVAIEAAALARVAERTRRLAAVEATIGPQLHRIAAGGDLTTNDRHEFLVAQERLRDGLRARQLDLPEITAAVRSARQRGVTVVLLDDHYPLALASDELVPVIAASVRMLNATTEGTVTIRLVPAGRKLLATLVADGEEYRRVDLATTKGSPSH
ncbi:MAG: hypothetical protein ACOH1K_00060 [Rhodoglobus sp.]